ncbi:MAG: Asp-tRNA(Asn)/Glu-tRNA(Gln) amidotransferase subunit GatB [Bdellovibrionales bacterium]|nr:Asp-tRNA(Asn)/Glu-tRNA(Gln) amidotransferase subunit GatB [Bdellovibrionales bacterium]
MKQNNKENLLPRRYTPPVGWKAVIGLEIHAQLLTNSKLFSPDPSHFIEMENEHIHPVSLGLPGTLPVLNQKALEYSAQVGLALNCHINRRSVFARKNYFYPDLPKGYQISQYEQPICENGYIEFEQEEKRKKVRIQRVHIEEDAGRFHHKGSCSLVNFNRAGVPLVEIVSMPDIHSPAEAAEMVRSIRKVLKYLDVCDGNLEEGSLRCDCNVSVQKTSDHQYGTRTELKNLNSFKFIEKAIEYEINRQILILKEGHKVLQETRLYDSTKNKTFPLRSKEEASDYRYFPDPDLLPLCLSDEWVAQQKRKIPESFLQKADRFQKQYELSSKESFLITEEKARADYFEKMVWAKASAKLSANWLINEVLAGLNEEKKNIRDCPIIPENLGEMLKMIEKKELSGKMGKKVFTEMWRTKKAPKQIVKKWGLKKIDDASILTNMATEVLKKFPKQVEDYKNGREKIFGFFVGEIMKSCRGQADPEQLNKILKEKLKN